MTNESHVTVLVALVALLAGCSGSHPAAPTPTAFLSGRVNLLAPSPGGRFVQNDPLDLARRSDW